MTEPAAAFLARWHAAVESRDIAGLRAWFAPDCEFRSPAVWTPKHGPEALETVLAGFISNVEDFAYRKEWVDASGREILLEFTAAIDGKSLVGIDRISLDAEGRVTGFEVMVRPLNALIEVAQRMAAYLAAHEGAA